VAKKPEYLSDLPKYRTDIPWYHDQVYRISKADGWIQVPINAIPSFRSGFVLGVEPADSECWLVMDTGERSFTYGEFGGLRAKLESRDLLDRTHQYKVRVAPDSTCESLGVSLRTN
jgi:hypothetical protein